MTVALETIRDVMTAEEAIAYLRLDHLGDPDKALQRCIDRGLRPAMYAKERRFTKRELDRWLDSVTEGYTS